MALGVVCGVKLLLCYCKAFLVLLPFNYKFGEIQKIKFPQIYLISKLDWSKLSFEKFTLIMALNKDIYSNHDLCECENNICYLDLIE